MTNCEIIALFLKWLKERDCELVYEVRPVDSDDDLTPYPRELG